MSRTQCENPKPTKNSGFREFISFILSDVEKFTDFNGTVIHQILGKRGDTAAWRS